MKMKWSVILSLALLLLIACGKEEFGSTPTTNTSKAEGVKQFEEEFCPPITAINPKVDVLFLVDNSASTYYLPDEIKSGIRNMISLMASHFDYRFVGAGLLPTDTTPFNDYQLITNSADPLSSDAAAKRIISAAELNFFMAKPIGEALETGLGRAVEFINANSTSSPGLFRQNANLVVVILSNGRDTEIELQPEWGGVQFNATAFNQKLESFKYIKNTLLNLSQLRLFSLTAHSSCKPGWFSSENSYKKMSNALYEYSAATDAPVNKDSYDLCSGVTNVFSPINESIKYIEINHTYRYWPIGFANSSHTRNDFGEITVQKLNKELKTSELIPTADWTYYEHTAATPLNTREPISGEPVNSNGEISGKHFIRFNDNALIKAPKPYCVVVKSSTRTEYFGYVVLNQDPKPDSIVLRINGKLIPKSNTNGWSYVGNKMNQNIKMPYPNSGDQFPAVYKSGFMLQLNGADNYYKSGDSVEANFIAAPL